MLRILTRKRRPLDGGPMPYDDEHQPVKRKRATQECDPPGIAGRVCDPPNGGSWRRSNPSASNPHRQFGAFPNAFKNSNIGARRTLACASDPKLHFTLNHYSHTVAVSAREEHFSAFVGFCRAVSGKSVADFVDHAQSGSLERGTIRQFG